MKEHTMTLQHQDVNLEIDPMYVGIDTAKLALLIRKLCNAFDDQNRDALDELSAIVNKAFPINKYQLLEEKLPELFQQLRNASSPEQKIDPALVGVLITTYLSKNTLMHCRFDNEAWQAVEHQHDLVSHNDQAHRVSVQSLIQNKLPALMATFVTDDQGLLRAFNPQLTWDINGWLQWADKIENSATALIEDLSQFSKSMVNRLSGFDDLPLAATVFQNAIGAALADDSLYTHTPFTAHVYCHDCNQPLTPKRWKRIGAQLHVELNSEVFSDDPPIVCRGASWRNPRLEQVTFSSGKIAMGDEVLRLIDRYFILHAANIPSFNFSYAYHQQFVQAAQHSLLAVEALSGDISAVSTPDGALVFVFDRDSESKDFDCYHAQIDQLGLIPMFEDLYVNSDTLMAIDIEELAALSSRIMNPDDRQNFTNDLANCIKLDTVELPLKGTYAAINLAQFNNKHTRDKALSMLPDAAQHILRTITSGTPMLVMVKQ